MAGQHISEDLKTFIKERMQTVLRLEVLLLLHLHRPKAFTAADLANELGVESEATTEELKALEANGLVARSERQKFKYQPMDETLRSVIDELAMRYSKQRIPILSVMLSEHPDRPRRFAEAFRIIRGTSEQAKAQKNR